MRREGNFGWRWGLVEVSSFECVRDISYFVVGFFLGVFGYCRVNLRKRVIRFRFVYG